MIYKPNIPEFTPFNPVTPLPWLATEESEATEEITPPVETTYVQQEEETAEPEKPESESLYTTDTTGLTNQEFVELMTQVYTNVLQERGISTEYARYLVAQDALESG